MTAADRSGEHDFKQALAGGVRRPKTALVISAAALVAGGIACFFMFLGASDVPRQPAMTASAEPPPPMVVAAAPTPEPSPVSEPLTASTPAVAQIVPSPGELPLAREEVTEVQMRLRSYGLEPGPVDGVAGTMTESAVRRYQQERGQAQTGTIDRELLVQLRYDPAPQVTPLQPAPNHGPQHASRRPAAAQAARPPARRSDPFEPMRTAGNQFSRWLHSLSR